MHYNTNLINTLKGSPDAVCNILGSDRYPHITGTVLFYQTIQGVVVVARVRGLPHGAGVCGNRVFACHIHSGGRCSGTPEDPFADAGTHFNSADCLHPYHAGDMPPLFANDGFAFSAFLTNRFAVDDVVGKTVIVHAQPDDFTTQPSGNAGEKIACGIIEKP